MPPALFFFNSHRLRPIENLSDYALIPQSKTLLLPSPSLNILDSQPAVLVLNFHFR